MAQGTSSITSALIVAALIGGAAGGIAGTFASLSVTVREPEPTAPPRRFALEFGAPNAETLANAAAPGIFLLFPAGALHPAGPGSFVPRAASIGCATAVSSDGWIVFDGALASKRGLTLVSGDGRTAVLPRAVIDVSTGLAFAKIDIHNLPALPLSRTRTPSSGSALIALFSERNGAPVAVTDASGAPDRLDDRSVSSESLASTVAIAPALGSSRRGCPLFDTGGTLVALAVGEHADRAVPAAHFASALGTLFRTGALHRPYLGARSVDISLLASRGTTLPQRGALLIDLPGRPAARPNSPAAAASLEAGDLITEIDADPLAPGETLAEALRNYAPGERITLTVRRGDEVGSVSVLLEDSLQVR